MPIGPQPAPARIVSIQYLRAVAALLVVGFHSGVRVDHVHPAFFIGQAGVDIFLVISGFVMWTVAETQAPGVIPFLRHRLARIVPLYWAVTVLYLVIDVPAPALFPGT